MDDILLAFELAISQNNAGDVGGEIAVAVKYRGGGIGKNGDGRHEDHVKAAGEIGGLFQRPFRQKGDGKAKEEAKENLGEQKPQGGEDVGAPIHEGNTDESHHVCRGIVTAAFHFQKGSGVVFEVQPFGTEDREDRRRVGGRNDRA